MSINIFRKELVNSFYVYFEGRHDHVSESQVTKYLAAVCRNLQKI